MSLFHALSPSPSFPPQEIWPSAKLLRETNCLSPIHHQEQEGQNKSQASASRQQQQIDDVPYILPSLSYSIEKLLLQSWFDISNRSSFSTWKQRQTGAWWMLLSFFENQDLILLICLLTNGSHPEIWGRRTLYLNSRGKWKESQCSFLQQGARRSRERLRERSSMSRGWFSPCNSCGLVGL